MSILATIAATVLMTAADTTDEPRKPQVVQVSDEPSTKETKPAPTSYNFNNDDETRKPKVL